MGFTVPNQKTVYISKRKLERDFVQVSKDDMYWASCLLTPSAFRLYMYLIGNKDGFELALSQVAFKNAMGVGKSAYYTAFDELVEVGYLAELTGNHYFFNERPVRKTGGDKLMAAPKNEPARLKSREIGAKNGDFSTKSDIEINIIDKIEKIDNRTMVNFEKLGQQELIDLDSI